MNVCTDGWIDACMHVFVFFRFDSMNEGVCIARIDRSYGHTGYAESVCTGSD